MLEAALNCLPQADLVGDIAVALAHVGTYLGLHTPIVLVPGDPLRLRVTPSIELRDAAAIDASLSALPDGIDVIVDMGDLEWVHPQAGVGMFQPLLTRMRSSRWIVGAPMRRLLHDIGVADAQIEIRDKLPISHFGQPIVLDGLMLDEEFVGLVRTCDRREAISLFRGRLGLGMSDAARAADELRSILARVAAPERGA